MNLPASLERAITTALKADIAKSIPLGGGDINHALKINCVDGREILVKWHAQAPENMFIIEQRGLELLRSTQTLHIPKVYASNKNPAFIAMEWLGNGSNPNAAQTLGDQLATMHESTAETYGLDHDNFIGLTPQPNQQMDNWVHFFQEQRLGYQMKLAEQNRRLPPQRARRLEKVIARLDEWLPEKPPASLLHGDLWGGNWLIAASGEPALIDPAVYYGDREAELAFTELFGGFPSHFYEAYNETWPLESGYQERKSLYNLYHLLNHLNLFGEGYGGRVDNVLKYYVD